MQLVYGRYRDHWRLRVIVAMAIDRHGRDQAVHPGKMLPTVENIVAVAEIGLVLITTSAVGGLAVRAMREAGEDAGSGQAEVGAGFGQPRRVYRKPTMGFLRHAKPMR